MNSETDLAGYRVYRSEQQDDKGQLLIPDLLLSPAYRDTSVRPEHTYWYRVTAVDRAGNESAPSAPVAADVAQHSS
jgi:fibronectin type 3 domain-containing protein